MKNINIIVDKREKEKALTKKERERYTTKLYIFCEFREYNRANKLQSVKTWLMKNAPAARKSMHIQSIVLS